MLPKNLSVCEKMFEEISVAESFVVGVDFDTFAFDEMIPYLLNRTLPKVGKCS